MLYKTLNSEKLRFIKEQIIYLLIFCFITTQSGCQTTEISYTSPDNLNAIDNTEIIKIELIDGTSIPCIGKQVKIEKNSDSLSFIVIGYSEISDSIKIGKDVYSYSTKWKEQRIDIKEIRKIQIEKNESDDELTGIFIGSFAGLVIIIGLIVLVNEKSKSIGF